MLLPPKYYFLIRLSYDCQLILKFLITARVNGLFTSWAVKGSNLSSRYPVNLFQQYNNQIHLAEKHIMDVDVYGETI